MTEEHVPIENPVHPTLIDSIEEDAVQKTALYASYRESLLQSAAQLAANRANAQKSTGPVTEAGKAISSRNNFRHGLTQNEGNIILLESESKEEYNQALTDFLNEWEPATPTERDLVERMVGRQWLRRRAMKLQQYYLSPADGQIVDLPNYSLYRRYESLHERAYNKALGDLIRLRSLRLREQNGFESQRRKNDEHIYRISTLKNRQKLQELAIRAAEARALISEQRLARLLNPKTDKNSAETAQ